jgi:hypothetical protein
MKNALLTIIAAVGMSACAAEYTQRGTVVETVAEEQEVSGVYASGDLLCAEATSRKDAEIAFKADGWDVKSRNLYDFGEEFCVPAPGKGPVYVKEPADMLISKR